MRLLLVLLIALSTGCHGNTETILVRVPKHFSVPPHPAPLSHARSASRQLQAINATHACILEWPIGSITLQPPPRDYRVVAPYDPAPGNPRQTLLVRLNNFNSSTFAPGDLLLVKLCWPATEPFEFALDIQYLWLESVDRGLHARMQATTDRTDTFDMYISINYRLVGQAHYHARRPSPVASAVFNLHVSKLPLSWLPIPPELYPIIVYVADIAILLAAVFPYINLALSY